MRVFSLLVVFLFSAGAAMADDRALDVTIKVVETPADLPGAVTKNIQLPPAAAQKSREKPAAEAPGSNNSPGESNNRGRGSTDDVVGENAPGKGKDKNKEKKKKN
jgi:hypothetical protein